MHQIIQKQLVAVGGRHFSKGSTWFLVVAVTTLSKDVPTILVVSVATFIMVIYFVADDVGFTFHSERVKNMLVFALLV